MAKIYALYGTDERLIDTYKSSKLADEAMIAFHYEIKKGISSVEMRVFEFLTERQLKIVSYAQAVGMEHTFRQENRGVINSL
jgi:hypothetical protein